MFDRDAWLEVAHNVLAHPLRTTLTGVSVALGIFILVVMQGLGYGLQHGVEGQFADDAVNSISVEGGRTQIAYRGNQSNRPVRLTNADLPGIASQADAFACGVQKSCGRTQREKTRGAVLVSEV